MLRYYLNVLLVEDNNADARLIREMLRHDGHFGASYAVAQVSNLAEAAETYSREIFDVILLDMNLPDSTGIATIQRLSGLAYHTPIIVLTAADDEQLALQLTEFGAQEYITKNECNGPLLRHVIHYAIERKATEERLKYLATHDALTELPNRSLFYDRLAQVLRHAARRRVELHAKWKVMVMLMDLNGFKAINDSLGHAHGDTVLRFTAQRLRGCLREADTVARLGGDEFVLIVEGVASRSDCLLVAQKVQRALSVPLSLDGRELAVQASLGISLFPGDAEERDPLIRCADVAMYAAKRQQMRICFYEDLKK